MSTEAYAAEKDNQPIRTEKEPSGRLINFSRSDKQKVIDKVRRVLTAIDVEIQETEPHNECIIMWAQEVIDDMMIFIPQEICQHNEERLCYTGDGIEVAMCIECGRNRLTGYDSEKDVTNGNF